MLFSVGANCNTSIGMRGSRAQDSLHQTAASQLRSPKNVNIFLLLQRAEIAQQGVKQGMWTAGISSTILLNLSSSVVTLELQS